MEGAFQNPVAQTMGSEQKTMFHGTLMSNTILIKVKEKRKKTE